MRLMEIPLLDGRFFFEGSFLRNKICYITKQQAQVLELKFFQDLKFSEISELTGISEGGLKANYHHARMKIEEYLRNCLNT